MKYLAKQYKDFILHIKRNEFHRATLLLTAKYSALIFGLLFFVSVLIYIVFTLKLGLTVGDGPLVGLFEESSYHHEESENLLDVLVLVNVLVWVLASALSYWLARITLQPIEDIHQQQEKFIGDVAHELRTPLAIIKSGAETTLRTERSNSDYREFIRESLEEINNITTISNDLLTLLKHKQNQPENNISLDFSELVCTQIMKVKEYSKRKNISFIEHIQENIFVRGVANDLSRMLLNLLKNAVDYNKVDGSVEIDLVQEGEYVVLEISDTGVGISKKDKSRIFDRFYKVDTARTQSDQVGSGLGLSIVKEIIDAHKGEISVVSDVERGSKFTISIPCV